MNQKLKSISMVMMFLFLIAPSEILAEWLVDFETGAVFSGYNDVRIPNDSGTLFSLSDELKTDPAPFFRVRLAYAWGNKHTIKVLVAPLRLEAEGKIDRLVRFEGKEFPANTELKSIYRFDSYRLTYRYDFYNRDGFKIGAGVTGKIRDASISLKASSVESEKKNTGFVPLVNFRLEWTFRKEFSILLDGDALAAPQGRAEDVLLALQYKPSRNVCLKVGYRILEGGADVDEVYSFALLNYIVTGVTIAFK